MGSQLCLPQIAKQAVEHVHANEVILTLGRSKTVESFLLAVSEVRPIEATYRLHLHTHHGPHMGSHLAFAPHDHEPQVIVCEAAPDFSGHEFAVSLASQGCKTTLVSDAAIFAMMARVNKASTCSPVEPLCKDSG